MNRREAINYHNLIVRLEAHGLEIHEVQTLLRASWALSRWAEAECNGEIERDEATGKPARYYENPEGNRRGYTIPDRETGALKRAAAIAKAHKLAVYHQTDPRGCALYLYNPRDKMFRTSTIDACYSAIGIAVCL